MNVLVIEDDRKIASFVKKGLQEQGMVVDVSREGDDGYFKASRQSYDVIVLDIMLPGRDGLSILKTLRQEGNNIPIILLTARAGLDDRVEGLNLGADDYLAKPFFTEELVARIHAVARRTTGDARSVRHVGDLVLNLISREVTRGESAIELTPREFNLLEMLTRSPGRVYTRTQILEHVWGYDFDPQTNLVDVYIRRVRRKIGDDASDSMIETVRGVGYRTRKVDT